MHLERCIPVGTYTMSNSHGWPARLHGRSSLHLSLVRNLIVESSLYTRTYKHLRHSQIISIIASPIGLALHLLASIVTRTLHQQRQNRTSTGNQTTRTHYNSARGTCRPGRRS